MASINRLRNSYSDIAIETRHSQPKAVVLVAIKQWKRAHQRHKPLRDVTAIDFG
jgi:hypothetical protein